MPLITREFIRQQTSGFYKTKITLAQFVVLDILGRQGQTKMSDLAHSINVTTAAMTGLVDRLVREGYARRSNDPNDRRIVKAALTPKGLRTVKQLIYDRNNLTKKMFGRVTQEEREEYLKILEHVRDHMEFQKG